MAFTVETGESIEGANAYIAVAYADDYHADRGHSSWTALDSTVKQAAIIKASEYIDKRFGRMFRGYRSDRYQGLEWPRSSAFDDDGYALSDLDSLPSALLKATAEYALRAATYVILAPDPLRPAPDQSFEEDAEERDLDTITGPAKKIKDVVGPIESEVEYATAAEMARSISAGARGRQSTLLDDFMIPQYPEADLWIEELIGGHTGSIQLVRA